MQKHEIDLNSDMGESFGPWQIGDGADQHIMPLISSANIATGFHAGDPATMASSVGLAKASGVAVGAHPGYRDLVGFGRRTIQASVQELVQDTVYQIGALQAFLQLEGMSMQHVKPHGALYMAMASDEALSLAFLQAVQRLSPQLAVYCMAGSATHLAANQLGVRAIREFFADRDYAASGSIVFTRKMGRLSPEAVADKVLLACRDGLVDTVDGQRIPIEFDSVCIHSDTPGALELTRATRSRLQEAGITIRAPHRHHAA
ncbi:5-oxoprolinase subunit PxpA [Aquitalea palustris]|uniref:5-oxoprolinase subunit A n=1 Tax=Aquitalea palustris TaxID=2480983 RepID=A0A454JE56_9NEIS|nr:5-oxoprolinase subunit PxpA [Aquitalea palustris]RMC92776.1 5-oxoprolinase subunit PxpA [Aquitalea palustris]